MKRKFPIVLSIAGSDPSGGAGIQADLKTISALGGYAAAAITAVTVQNTQGVTDVRYLSSKIVREQIESVMDDLHPDAVKIGMTGSVPVIRAIVQVLRKKDAAPSGVDRTRPVVFDPVMASTSRHPLTRPEAVSVMCNELFPLCTLVTPNLNETGILLGEKIGSLEAMRQAAADLHRKYGSAFLVKGGDMEGARESVDVLCDGTGLHLFRAPHIDTKNLHGTGCTLSSAVATLLGRGFPVELAVRQAKDYVRGAILAARDLTIGSGQGPLWHFYSGGE